MAPMMSHSFSLMNTLSFFYLFQVIRRGDVVLEFDGVPIANDGTVHLRYE